MFCKQALGESSWGFHPSDPEMALSESLYCCKVLTSNILNDNDGDGAPFIEHLLCARPLHSNDILEKGHFKNDSLRKLSHSTKIT